MTTRQAVIGFAGWALLVILTAMSGILSPPGSWYAALQKPPFTPPDLAFPIVWTLLYALMTVSVFLVWRKTTLLGGLPTLLPFVAQLGANGLWSILFFQWHRPDLALVDLIILWALILLTILRFHRVRPLAAWLLAPYLAWVTLAGYLNIGIIVLNGPAPPG
ncbi:tryptophan-rich sensory protein [Spiribacter sp. C176]|uniref:Tryptophan-rich sensory protein n=1 Tax=Spiribacter salilacus TaxID=2664894 RepID=A0A6N7QSK5_9GAMM|nr:TspO/MBR family protein [Spiribacter salilacus]MRH78972.1 tryptophan-rich sensory protein [Spiribacter salilacus]